MHQATHFEPWPGTDWPKPRALIPSWAWQLVLAAVLASALLVAFHNVVQGVVVDGERRRQQDALLAMQVSHCNTMGDQRFAADCLRKLGRTARIGRVDAAVPQLLAQGH